MYDNWSEIIEIMKSVLGLNRSRTELKMALSSCLRILGWRISTGTMKCDYGIVSGETIDIVLGSKNEDGSFHASLPIITCSKDNADSIIDYTSKIMATINAKIAIVVGKSFDLFFFDTDTNSAFHVGEVCFDFDNEEGIKFFSLLSARDFDESSLVSYFESLFVLKLPSVKLDAIIKELIDDKSKQEDVLRLYLEFEGFEGEIVDKALQNVGVDIFYKNINASEVETTSSEVSTSQLVKSGHDNTRFSLNGGLFLSKRNFVHSVVAQYIKDNPMVTFDQLEQRFPSEIISKTRGVVRTFSQVKEWAKQNDPDILNRYCTKPNEILRLSDGTEIVVNSQWGSKNFPRFLELANEIYQVASNSPYGVVDCSEKEDITTADSTKRRRDSNFKFSMAGVQIGETIVFTPTNVRVTVVSDDSIEYEGRIYRLSSFVKQFIPDKMRKPCEAYRGPNYFTYNGEVLTSLRYKEVKNSPSQSENNDSVDLKKGVQISMHSLNTFKRKK